MHHTENRRLEVEDAVEKGQQDYVTYNKVQVAQVALYSIINKISNL
jgi:hypothetical protein